MRKVSWIAFPEPGRRPKESSLIYCPGACRAKLQFKTLKEARDYIRWNSLEILREAGRAPVRAYWCGFCCCYHVTSKQKLPPEPDQAKQKILNLLSEALQSEEPVETGRLIGEAYQELQENLGKPWAQEVASKILLCMEEKKKGT